MSPPQEHFSGSSGSSGSSGGSATNPAISIPVSTEISVVVASYNGARIIAPCIEALLAQNQPVDIYVVDDGSTDDLADVVARYPVTLVDYGTGTRENRGSSAARNAGLAAATTPWVAFCDDDCSPPPDWTERLVAAWRTVGPEVVAIAGEVVVDNPTTLNQRYLVQNHQLHPLEAELAHAPTIAYRILRQFRSVRIAGSGLRPIYAMCGANMSVDRVRTEAIGGFNPEIRFGGDDLYLSCALREQYGDASLVADPSIVMGHRFAPDLADTWRRSRAYGKGAGQRWVREGGLPTVQLFGVAAIGTAVVMAPVSLPGALAAGVVVGVLPRARWFRTAVTQRSAEMLLYPFIALAEEVISLWGFIRGTITARTFGTDFYRSAQSVKTDIDQASIGRVSAPENEP